MKRVIGLFPAICSLALVMACTDSPTAPVDRPPQPLRPPSPTSSIDMRLTPASGANVEVFQCSPGGASYVFHCTGMDQVTAVFDVAVDLDIPDAAVAVRFMDGLRTCATASVRQSLVAGTRAELVMRDLILSGDEGLLCQLPVTTTAVQVAILRPNPGGSPAYLHHYTQTLPHVYTFAWPE
jgi:hypothetical protein